ncbi:hypothetical protein AGMMS49992_11620 [Clostridia bacterium]|nr:hypothetical protein AGMMS49992_11620 [Clostridia bacterium]
MRGTGSVSECLETKELLTIIMENPLPEAMAAAESLRLLAQIDQHIPPREQSNEQLMRVEDYSQGLFNLVCIQPRKPAEATVVLLQSLSREYDTNLKVVMAYAFALNQFSQKQSVYLSKVTVESLCEIARDERYAGNHPIALALLEALVFLSYKQKPVDARKSLDTIREFANDKRYTVLEEMLITRYAIELANLISRISVDDADVVIEDLHELSLTERYQGIPEFARAYARGLALLTVRQPLNAAAHPLDVLRKMSQTTDDVEIKVVFAHSLSDRFLKQARAKSTDDENDNPWDEMIALTQKYPEVLSRLQKDWLKDNPDAATDEELAEARAAIDNRV